MDELTIQARTGKAISFLGVKGKPCEGVAVSGCGSWREETAQGKTGHVLLANDSVAHPVRMRSGHRGGRRL